MTIDLEAAAATREKNNAALITALDHKGLNDPRSDRELDVRNDAERGRWTAKLDAETIAELQHLFVGSRLVLLSTWVDPAHRNSRATTEFVARVLDEIRESGKKFKITVICPVVGKFIAHHPEYADLVDKVVPGAGAGPKNEPDRGDQDEELTAFERDMA